MYKCNNDKCEFTLSDDTVSFNTSNRINLIVNKKFCPKCSSKLIYINELQEKYERYKKIY